MKALKYIFFLILILIIASSVYVAVQPNAFNVTRVRVIKAPASVVYNNVIEYKNWEDWSPWQEQEPDMKITYPEQTRGIGGSYTWLGKDGMGTMETLYARDFDTIAQNIQFDDYDPSKVIWSFTPDEDGSTKVVWTMQSDDIPFIFKGIALISGGFDKMIGPSFERGLERLDSLSVAQVSNYDITVDGLTQYSGGFYIYNTTSCKMKDFEPVMQSMMTKLNAYAQTNNITADGAPFVLYHKWDEANNATIFSCCLPTSSEVITAQSDILTGQLDAFKAVKVTLKGDYRNLKEAWDKGMAYAENYNLEILESGPMIEAYVKSAYDDYNPANWTTEIYIAVK
jgi:effector-binding domain-containing protein